MILDEPREEKEKCGQLGLNGLQPLSEMSAHEPFADGSSVGNHSILRHRPSVLEAIRLRKEDPREGDKGGENPPQNWAS